MPKRKKLLLILIFFALFTPFSAAANELFLAFTLFNDSLPANYEEIIKKLPANMQDDLDKLYNIMDRMTDHKFGNKERTDAIKILLRTNYLKINIIQEGYGDNIIIENISFSDFYNNHKSRALEMHKNVINALNDLAGRNSSYKEYLNMFANLSSNLDEYL